MSLVGIGLLAIGFVLLALEGAGLFVAIRRLSDKPPASLGVRGLAGATVICFVLGPFLGVGVGVVSVSMAFRAAADADPSEKARVLAQGISEAMNLVAFGMMLPLPFAVGMLVQALVTRRRPPLSSAE